MSTWTLRPCSPADVEWLWETHAATMREAAEATWAWDDGEQRRHFARTLDLEAVRIIVEGGEDVGVLWLEDRGLDLFLCRLEVLPAHQGGGLGGAIVVDLVRRAHGDGRLLRLRVLRTNPRARALYERCGLSVYDQTPTHWKMSSNR